jgi:hypothetical protein
LTDNSNESRLHPFGGVERVGIKRGRVDMKNKKLLLVGAMVLVFLGPVSIGWCIDQGKPKYSFPLSPEELAYLERADQVIHEVNAKHNKDGTDSIIIFSMPKEQADEAWSRITAFLTNYGPGMAEITEFELATLAYSQGNGNDYAYSVKKMPIGNEVKFTAHCAYQGYIYKTGWSSQNVHILALYALTGELIPKLVALR